MTTFLVRIKPSSPCDNYNEFTKRRGWHRVDAARAEWCRQARISDLHPNAELVFDVVSEEEAAAIAKSEAKRVDPSGTPQVPIDMVPPVPAAEVSVEEDDVQVDEASDQAAEPAKFDDSEVKPVGRGRSRRGSNNSGAAAT